jgi:mannose-6-phosphate isomerase-like protein (cupin superfamily)
MDAPLRHETIVLVLDGRARAGTTELAAGEAMVVPAGTAFAVEPNGHTLLVGR